MIEKNLKYLLFVLHCIFANATTVFCQSDTTIRIAQIVIQSQRISRYADNHRTVKVDSLTKEIYSGQTMTDLLTGLNVAFVKNYGPGTLATLSSRGMGASQTSIIWNGINLQNGMNGTVDPSLFPVGMVDEAFFISGGVSALYGSGNIGGALFLNHKMEWNRGLGVAARLGYGSFDNYNFFGQTSYSDAKLSFYFKAMYQQAENRFSFKNSSQIGAPRVLQTNNFLNNFNLLPGFTWRFSKQGYLNVNAWIYDNYRQIPGTMLSANANAKQKDNGFRGVVEYKSEFGKSALSIRSAYNHERLIFHDEKASIFSNSLTQHWMNEVEFRFSIRKTHSFESVVSSNYYRANSTGLNQNNPNQNRISGFVAHHYTSLNQKLLINSGIRVEYLWGGAAPLLPVLSLQYKVISPLTLSAGISRNFRFPTLNDLYWNPGGNPDLKYESAWNFDAGLNYISYFANQRFKQELSLKGFFIHLKNRILWIPQSAFWSPENVPLSFSRGLEFRHLMFFNLNKVTLSLSYSYNFTRSTNESLLSEGDDSMGKQLIYVPLHMANIQGSISWKGYQLGIVNQYTGERFTTSDNSASLPAFVVSNLFITKNFSINKIQLGFNVNINNLFNQSFQVMLWRAMPGINFNCGISIKFQHKIKHNEKF